VSCTSVDRTSSCGLGRVGRVRIGIDLTPRPHPACRSCEGATTAGPPPHLWTHHEAHTTRPAARSGHAASILLYNGHRQQGTLATSEGASRLRKVTRIRVDTWPRRGSTPHLCPHQCQAPHLAVWPPPCRPRLLTYSWMTADCLRAARHEQYTRNAIQARGRHIQQTTLEARSPGRFGHHPVW
jgi:hypothetical protein